MNDQELIGKKIVEVRKMTQKELSAEGWEHDWGVALVLENGVVIYPSRDDEGNGAGRLFGTHKGEDFHIFPDER